MREHAHLRGRQRAIGNGDAQHIGVELEIETVLQPQRTELVFAEFACKAPSDLFAKLRDAAGDEIAVEFIVAIHGYFPAAASRFLSSAPKSTVGPLARMSSRRRSGTGLPASIVTSTA